LKVGNRTIFLTAILLITILIVDTALERISDLLGTQSSDYTSRVVLFIAITLIIYVVGEYLILSFIKRRNNEIIQTITSITREERTTTPTKTVITNKNKFLARITLLYKTILTVQVILTVIIVSIILSMIFASHYYTSLLITSTVISYGFAIVLLVLLTQRLISWFKRTKKNAVLFSYGLASAAIALNLIFLLAFNIFILISKPSEVREHLTTIYPAFASGSFMGILNSLNVVSGIISFILVWISTSLLLRHYSTRIGRVRYWVIVCIPLAYFVSQFIPIFVDQIARPLITQNPIFMAIVFTLIFTVSKPVGGILFGVAFWIMAKALRHTSVVRDYMIISAVGIILLFVSVQGSVIFATYPPFGLVTVSFVGLSSYMTFIGLYSVAMSVAGDISLRQTIRKTAIEESRFIDSIVTAQMEQELEWKVLRVAKKHTYTLEQETGIEPSLTGDDLKQYLQEVLSEVKVHRNQSNL
jgi:hypothetical protein